MTNTTSPQDLGERIEQLVREYISASRIAARAAMDRAFASSEVAQARRPRLSNRLQPGRRRASSEVAALGERFYEAVCDKPGETMAVLAPIVGASARELHRPMTLLKQAGRLRSVGTRHATRYFPLAAGATSTR